MHPLPCRHRKGRRLDDPAALGHRAAGRSRAGDGRRLDLRPRAGRDEPGKTGAETLPRGCGVSDAQATLALPVDTLLADELATEELVEMANLTSAQTGVVGTIFISAAMGAHGPRVKYVETPGRTQPSFSASIAE